MDLANVLAKMGMPNAMGEVTATPPAPDAQAWLNPDPKTLNMKVHGEWQEFRARSNVTRYLNDHLGFWMFGNEYGHFASGGPGLTPEEACQMSADQHVNWRRTINQGLWVIACKPGEAFMQLRHETDGVPPLYTYEFNTFGGDGNSESEFTEGDNTTRSVDENTPRSQNIGDPVTPTGNDGDTLIYSLSGPDADSFDIVESSGQLLTRHSLDYETKSRYSVTVSVLDGSGGLDSTADDSIIVTTNITNVNEPPSAPFGDSEITVPENTTGTLQRYTSTDPKRATVTLSLTGSRTRDPSHSTPTVF